MPAMSKICDEDARLVSIIDRFPLLRIAVWGDFILDEYLYGTTRRISREAPVMIISYTNREFSLGGAGNAARNLSALGIEVEAIGVVGDDDGGREVRRLLAGAAISDRSIVVDRGFATPLKTRVLAGEDNTKKQQVLRIDRESEVPAKKAVRNRLSAGLKKAISSCDALLVSDYHYQTVAGDLYDNAASLCRKSGLPLSVDSRFRLRRFRGCTIATPNEPEVEAQLEVRLGAGRTDVVSAGRTLIRRLQSSALLITRGSKGMALFEKGKPPFFLPVSGSTDIVDVTGAGDTVIAVFTAALAAGASFREAARLANHAGGLVVMKKGTAVVRPLELKQAVYGQP